MDKVQKIISALNTPELRPIIDKNALIKTGLLQEVLDHAIKKHNKDRNWEPLRGIAQLFAASKYYYAIIEYICGQTGLEYRAGPLGKEHFYRPKKIEIQSSGASLDSYLFDESLHYRLSDLCQETEKKKENKPVGGDAMLRRVPGSFGSGRI